MAQKTIARLVEDAAVVLQKIVRVKAADESGYYLCCYCQKPTYWKDGQGAHWISRTWKATKLVEENINASCAGCNQFPNRYHDDYTAWMYDQYGKDFCDHLSNMKRQTTKWSRADIVAHIENLKAELKELLEVKGLS